MFKNYSDFRYKSSSPSQLSVFSRYTEVYKSLSRVQLFSPPQLETIAKENEEHEDKISVVNLNEWGRSFLNLNSLQIIEEANLTLQRRMKHEVLAENIIEFRNKEKLSKSAACSPVNADQKRKKSLDYDNIKQKSKNYQIYENELSTVYETMKEKLQKINREREELRKEVVNLRLQLKDESESLESNKKTLENVAKQKLKPKHKDQTEVARMFHRKLSIRDEIGKREAEFLTISEEISKEIMEKGREIESLDFQSSELRKEIQIMKEGLIKHYCTTLKEGKDTRFEGLCWIVNMLKDLGLTITPYLFPSFLDERSISTIIDLAAKLKDLEDKYARLSLVSSPRSNRLYSSNDKWNGIHTRLSQATKKLRTKMPVIEVEKGVKKRISWANCNPDHKSMKITDLNNLAEYDIIIKNIKNEIKNIREQEIARINKECVLYNYNIKKRVPIKLLFAAIVGVENLEKYKPGMIKVNVNRRL